MSKSTLTAKAELVRTEVIEAANSADRIGQLLKDIIAQAVFNTEDQTIEIRITHLQSPVVPKASAPTHAQNESGVEEQIEARITQSTGQSVTLVMSQKALTDELVSVKERADVVLSASEAFAQESYQSAVAANESKVESEEAAAAAFQKELEASEHAVDAQAAKTGAQTAQGLTEQAKIASEAARDKAQEWSEKDEDVEVEEGKFSSKHFSIKSGKSAEKSQKWASEAEDVVVEGGEFSAKHYSLKAKAEKEDAQTAKTGAETARDKSQQWSENPENVEVEAGKFSAKHYSLKASVAYLQLPNTERALADILSHLLGRIETLEQELTESKYAAMQVDELSVVNNIKLKGADLILFGTAAPAVTPDFVGQFFVNTTGGVTYQAKGIANSGDWKQTSN